VFFQWQRCHNHQPETITRHSYRTPVMFIQALWQLNDVWFNIAWYALLFLPWVSEFIRLTTFIICPMRQQHCTDYKNKFVSVSESVSQWVSESVNFGTPSISQKRLKLVTSNLAYGLATGRPKRNNANLGQIESIRGHVTYFLKYWDPLHISGTVEAGNV